MKNTNVNSTGKSFILLTKGFSKVKKYDKVSVR